MNRFCQYFTARDASNASATQEGRRDPSSFVQMLSATKAVSIMRALNEDSDLQRRPFSGEQERFDEVHKALDQVIRTGTVEQLIRRPNTILSNEQAQKVLSAGLDFLLSLGNLGKMPCDIDEPPHPAIALLLQRISLAIAQRTEVEDVVAARTAPSVTSGCMASLGNSRRNSKHSTRGQLELLLPGYANRPSGPVVTSFMIFMSQCLETIVIERGTIVSGVLETVEWFTGRASRCLPSYARPPFVNLLDPVEMAESWIKFDQPPHKVRHILSYKFLFDPETTALHFRCINHIKMRGAVSASEEATALRKRVAKRTVTVDSSEQLKEAEEHYLLLNVSRSNLLRDAYNQLWQRRKSELLRPLRVRLGEVEELEVGHDLGGVQIEFFNLVCKEAFADDAQMFTTDVSTGLSYFRPASLQPLYMFELVGLLVGLAMYNGITLPLSFPTAFYAFLTRRREAKPITISDGWPSQENSLRAVLTEDLDLEYSFPMEANGLTLSKIRRHQQQTPEQPDRGIAQTWVLEVKDAVPDGGGKALSDEEVQNIDWPGWALTPASSPTANVTPANREQYVRDYYEWLTYGSVAPQWGAFMKGFESIIDQHTLSIFTAVDLKAYVEGSLELDMDELIQITTYEGYAGEDSRYIRDFWELVYAWPKEKQKQLLKFVTAVERVPLDGMKRLVFKISEVPDLDNLLPTSSTCFGTLYLPRYSSVEILEERLSLTLEYGSEGFGTG